MTEVCVVGGTYTERCWEPTWMELLGSGLRAALVLRQLGAPVEYFTYATAAQQPVVESAGRSADIKTTLTPAAASIAFSYRHALARPFIDPPLHRITPGDPIRVTGSVVLRYGMLEGDAIVAGTHVVYDPQSAEAPKWYNENGSTAKHLAVIANAREATLLTNERSHLKAAAAILSRSHADVVVIKRGARGCTVVTATDTQDIPAYFAANIFPIGSGDVFSAAFTWAWAVEGNVPAKAADFASRATAAYCNAPKTLLAGNYAVPTPGELRAIRPKPEAQQTVYLAGPFFSTAQRWIVEESFQSLKDQHVQVFSPFHAIGIGPAHKVANADIKGLERSQAVLALVDGQDAGTLFEIGWARAKGIPVIALAESEPEEPLKMVEGTGCEVVADFVSAIYRAAWAALER